MGTWHRRSVLLALTLALLTACVADNRPASCDGDVVTLDLTLTAEALTPSSLGVCRGQDVTLRIDSEVDGLIHIHGYEEAVSATEVRAGEELELTFPADRSGQFPVEFHPAGNPEGVGVGVFTVYEP